MHAPRLALSALVIGLLAPLSAGNAEAERAHARFQQRAAAATRFQGWSPLSDYVAAGLGEGGSFRLTLPTRAGYMEVALHPTAVHAADYHGEEAARDRERRGRGLPAIHAFAGSVARAGRAPSARKPGGDFARLAREPGGRISGLLRVEGALYDLAADTSAGDLVLHVREVTPEELAAALGACGAVLDAALSGSEAGAGEAGASAAPASSATSSVREIELGTEADAPFVAQAGGVTAANARILSIVNSINGIYEFDLGLTNRVVFQRAWNGSDPYSSNDSDILLNEFRSHFLANVPTETDDAQLFSGRDFENNTVGRAFVSSACSSFGFGVNQFYRQSDSLTRLIVAHEMGHNLGGGHTSDGIMASSINPNVTWFGGTSQNQIASYVNGVSCLSQVATSGAPVLDPIGPQSVRENEVLAFQLEASDPDGDPVSWGATPLPSGASLSANGRFEWRLPRDSVGCGGFLDRTVTFTASDPDGNQASEAVVISVLDVPRGATPVLADPANRRVAAGQAFSIPLAASDADGDSLSFTATNLPSGASLSAGGVFDWTPSTAQLGTYLLAFTATDCTGRSASKSVSIEVVASAPVLGSLSPASAAKGEFVVLSGENFAGRRVKVYFGPKRVKAREVTDTSLVVKVPRKPKAVLGSDVAVTLLRDGIASVNALSFIWLEPTP